MNVITGAMFRKNALEREKKEIQRYQRQLVIEICN